MAAAGQHRRSLLRLQDTPADRTVANRPLAMSEKLCHTKQVTQRAFLFPSATPDAVRPAEASSAKATNRATLSTFSTSPHAKPKSFSARSAIDA